DTPGGGGYGDPLARPAERVLADVREGFISPEAAEHEYGVVLTSDRDGIDEDGTTKKRAMFREGGASSKLSAPRANPK
ncbi:MAG: hypothetical protein ACRECE_03375, partial [Xanthobacteraceae bacterium]